MKYTLDFNKLYIGKFSFISTEKWVANAHLKFSSEARPNQYIVPFVNTVPNCIPLSGHFVDIEGRVLVHQTKRYQLRLMMPHGDKGRFLVLICTPPLSSTKLV